LTEKIELIKNAVLETKTIAFDYCYDKGDVRRRVEPYFVIFQWSAWYVFGFCPERMDWRLFKLLRMRNLTLGDAYAPREIPLGCMGEQLAKQATSPEKRDFNAQFPDTKKLVALFDPAAKYQLMEAYGPDSFAETDEGLLFTLNFSNDAYMIQWLLGFGDKVKVLEPADVAEGIRAVAENILGKYK